MWQDKRTAIAQTVDALGDQFRPAMRAGWLLTSRTRIQMEKPLSLNLLDREL